MTSDACEIPPLPTTLDLVLPLALLVVILALGLAWTIADRRAASSERDECENPHE